MEALPGLLILLLLAPPALARDPAPAKTNPAHMDPAPMIPKPPWPPAEAHMTDPLQTTWLILKDTAYKDFGKFDPVLSNACIQGRFAPTRSLYRVLLTGPKGQANLDAVPLDRRDLLHDPDKRARPKEVYYFRNAGWPDCEVRYDGPEPPRILDPRGTTVPPVNREQRKKDTLEKYGKKTPPK
jgi:hypothetical protein